MSDYDFNCPECGGSDGLHFDDCVYDGTDGAYGTGGYHRSSKKHSSTDSNGMLWLFYIFALIIGYGINELLGTILLIGWIIYVAVNK